MNWRAKSDIWGSLTIHRKENVEILTDWKLNRNKFCLPNGFQNYLKLKPCYSNQNYSHPCPIIVVTFAYKFCLPNGFQNYLKLKPCYSNQNYSHPCPIIVVTFAYKFYTQKVLYKECIGILRASHFSREN